MSGGHALPHGLEVLPIGPALVEHVRLRHDPPVSDLVEQQSKNGDA
jgi:hypothetical protein